MLPCINVNVAHIYTVFSLYLQWSKLERIQLLTISENILCALCLNVAHSY